MVDRSLSRLRSWSLPSICLLAVAPALALRTVEQQPEVELTLACDVEVVEPGTTFEVAALFEIEEEWHIYWRDPGDSGLATSATLTVPEGFTVEGPRFPAPEVVPLAGGLSSYAYHDEVALFFTVTAPDSVTPETALEFKVQADWLVCKEACFMGGAEARLEFKAGAGGGASEGLARAIERSRARLPQPTEKLWGFGWRWSEPRVEGLAGKYVVELQLKPLMGSEGPRIPRFIPDSTGGLALRIDKHRPTPPGKYVLESQGHPRGTTALGVLVFTSDQGSEYYSLEVPYTDPTDEH